MELQFEKTLCHFLRDAAGEEQAQEQTQEIKLPDGMPDVGRVIQTWGQVILRGKEWRGDSVSANGGVMVWVLYGPEDGTEPRVLESWIPFRMKWDLPQGTGEGDIRVCCLLRSVDARTISPRKILARAGICCRAEAWAPDTAEVAASVQAPEQVELLKRSYPVRLAKEAGEKPFVLDEELSFPAVAPKPERLICATMQPQITDQKVMTDKAVFRGSGNLHTLYRGEDGGIHSWDFELPFSQFGDLRGSFSPEAQLSVRPCVTSLETELGSERQLRVKCGIVAQYLTDDQQLLEVVEDAYSPRREVQVQKSELMLPVILDRRMETICCQQTIPMDPGQVADSAFFPDYSRQRRTEEGVELENSGLFQILGNGGDGALRSGNARWEESTSIPAGEKTRLVAWVQPMGRPQVAMGDGVVNLSMDLQMSLETLGESGIPMVTSLEVGGLREKDPAAPALILRRSGAEDLWTLAKRCGSTVGAIREANDLQEEPDPGRMLLIPVS